MPWGIVPTGFSQPKISDILDEVQAAQLLAIPTLDLLPPDPIAVMTGIFCAKLADGWQVLQALYSGGDPDMASNDQLAGIALISGTIRQDATKTAVVCTVTVDAAFSALAGTMFASVVGVPGVLFKNADDFTAGGAGSTTGVVFSAVVAGPTTVNAGTLTVMASPLTHWTAITNPAAGTPGVSIEGDPALRAERELDLAAEGSTNAAAIAADVRRLIQPGNSPLTIDGIATSATMNPFTLTGATLGCTVLWNDTDAVDANGLPAHSIEAIAYAPSATTADTFALAALILVDKAAGITTYSGNGTSKSVTDDQGITVTVYYTRPTAVPTNIAITVKQASGVTLTDNDIKDAIFKFAKGTDRNGVVIDGAAVNWLPGVIAYASHVAAAAFIPGAVDVPSVTLSAANVGVNVVPTVRQIVTIGTITVTRT